MVLPLKFASDCRVLIEVAPSGLRVESRPAPQALHVTEQVLADRAAPPGEAGRLVFITATARTMAGPRLIAGG